MRILSPFFPVSLLAAATLLTACYNPIYGNNGGDARMAFQCFASDNPSCPANLVCCDGNTCGDQLGPTQQGWCVLPPAPVDMTLTPLEYWDFGVKSLYYSGPMMDPQLTGFDDTGKWRCHRDDTNPSPTDKEVRRALEPNDLPASAISLSNPLMTDPPAQYMGSQYEICPDRSAPLTPDFDTYRFKIASPVKVIVELKYKVNLGDLDVALFRQAKDPDTGVETSQRVLADLTNVDNACIEANNLMAGTYFVVVRGALINPEKPGVYAMNNYTIKVYATTGAASCAKKDGGL